MKNIMQHARVTQMVSCGLIWQASTRQFLLKKNDRKGWGLMSSPVEEEDTDLCRHTLERGLQKKGRGTMNPLNFDKPGTLMKCQLLDAKAFVCGSNGMGTNIITHPRGYRADVRMNVVHFLEETSEVTLSALAVIGEFDYLSRILDRGEAVLEIAQQAIAKAAPIVAASGDASRPARMDMGDLRRQLNFVGTPPDKVERFTSDYMATFRSSLAEVQLQKKVA